MAAELTNGKGLEIAQAALTLQLSYKFKDAHTAVLCQKLMVETDLNYNVKLYPAISVMKNVCNVNMEGEMNKGHDL